MELKHFINERLKITSNSKSVTIRPKSKDELKDIIKDELKRQGPDADLNHIDTSEITDMSRLFFGFIDIQNIKIDQWDVSNVRDMSYMFYNCTNFNSDLSHWNVSNVENMSYMFMGCSKLKCDLSGWDVSKVGPLHTHIFRLATKMKPHLRPKPSW